MLFGLLVSKKEFDREHKAYMDLVKQLNDETTAACKIENKYYHERSEKEELAKENDELTKKLNEK